MRQAELCTATSAGTAHICRGQGRRAPHARQDLGYATWSVGNRELCEPRTEADGNPVTESNLSRRASAQRAAQSVRQRLLGAGPALARRSGRYVSPKGAMTFDHPNNADERASVLPGQCGVLFGRCIWLAYSPGCRRWKIGSRSAVPWLEGWQRNTRRLSRPTSWVPWLSSARMTARAGAGSGRGADAQAWRRTAISRRMSGVKISCIASSIFPPGTTMMFGRDMNESCSIDSR